MQVETVRRLAALIAWLPADAAYYRSIQTAAPTADKPANVVSLAQFAKRHANHHVA